MSDGVSIVINNTDVLKMLEGMYSRGAELTPVLKRISQMLRSFSMENFLQEGRPSWQAWSTVTQKKRKGGKILQKQASRGLKGSITPFINGTSAGIGSVLKYARIHQLGGWAGRNRTVHIPQREYLTPTDDDMDMICETVSNYLTKGK